MADETTKVADNGASQAQDNAQPRELAKSLDQGDAASGAGTRVSDRSASPTKNDDLSNHPQFKALRSSYESKMAEMRNEIQAARRAAEQALTKDMTQAEREEYARSQEYQEFMAAKQELEVQRQAIQRQQDILALSSESGAPYDVLDQAQTYDEAVKLALGWAKKTAAQQAQATWEAQQAKREANSVDVGGGKANSPEDEWERQYKEAKATGDVKRLMELTFQRG